MSVNGEVRWPPEAAADYEELRVASGPRSGATIAIAVHSTVLGPALGGARVWHYESPADGIEDALRLARAMTYKAAAAARRARSGPRARRDARCCSTSATRSPPWAAST
jgi:leucine dehydrogenase